MAGDGTALPVSMQSIEVQGMEMVGGSQLSFGISGNHLS